MWPVWFCVCALVETFELGKVQVGNLSEINNIVCVRGTEGVPSYNLHYLSKRTIQQHRAILVNHSSPGLTCIQ